VYDDWEWKRRRSLGESIITDTARLAFLDTHLPQQGRCGEGAGTALGDDEWLPSCQDEISQSPHTLLFVLPSPEICSPSFFL
jgi:hypothetical protein